MTVAPGDPVAALAEWLAAVDVAGRDSAHRLRRSERNRIGLLLVHGMFALVVAPLFAAQLGAPGGMSSPSFALLRAVPGAPYSLAFLLGLGGAILVPATIARHRPWEMTGLGLLIAWYGLLAAALLLAFIPWAMAGSPSASRPSLFGPAFYAHFATIMAVHLRTLWHLHRRETP